MMHEIDGDNLMLSIPKNIHGGNVANNQKENHAFRFAKVFSQDAK